MCLTGILGLDNFKHGESGFEIIFSKKSEIKTASEESEENMLRIKSKKGTFVLWKSRFLEYTVESHNINSKQFFL